MSSLKPGPALKTIPPLRYTTSDDILPIPLDPHIFQEVRVVRIISSAKFPVYLVCSGVNRKLYAMKVFSTKGDKSTTYFLNEIRFSCLHHKNVIQIHYYDQQNAFRSKTPNPHVIMEYAPYGDLFDFVKNFKHHLDDKLIRTYLHHLIAGVEYLHIKGIAHLDLKLENLLIGEDFLLKIADFDLSYIIGDLKVYSKGTKYYRAPEFREGTQEDCWALDMYSIGVILFALKTRGVFPHTEDQIICGVNLNQLLNEDNAQFWRKHAEILEVEESYFEQEFRDLFNGLVDKNPQTRWKPHQVKKSQWYQGPVYTSEELRLNLSKLFQ